MDDMVAYDPPESLWRLIEDHISPHENEEIRRMLGESLIEQSIDLHQEVEMLLDIWRSVREESESKVKPVELPEPPEIRDRLIKEILFFINGVKEKAALNGFDPEKVVSGHNKDVISYALKTQGTTSRPGTPRSTDSGRETPLIPSDKRLYEETEVKRDVISMNDKLNFLQFDQVVESLRSHLEKEVEQLLLDTQYIQQCIDTESAFPGTGDSIEREPTLTELKEERSLLEKELIPDIQVKPRNHLASPSSKTRPNVHVITSKPSPMKASHSISSTVSNLPQLPHKKFLHEQLKFKPGANTSRLKVVPVSKVIDRYGECSRLKLTPSPPSSDRSVTPERPSSAARFRRMVLECREGD
ncbi:hypothetical protein LOTGIDRAFT_237762 [Lottia gigantea]|uniref:Coiled-coil domain-containing protein 24 n=1 Tax=Lottia gigantea TaxID=225164 RepID=V4AH48_LOTGI|nr:hypothetical protein LOTGIDRAFT_237762 [Lottia gigantea]ESP03339.1 hypothetical protein LOTGIDRAFT_237762 [Lottia gigantea]